MSSQLKGVQVPDEMREILARNPGFIRSEDGGQRIVDLYVQGTADFTPWQLSKFGFLCFYGCFDDVKSGNSPDLSDTETSYQLSYASIIILGAQRVVEGPPGSKKWAELLDYLLSKGMNPDIEDIVWYTALDHATTGQQRNLDLARILLSSSHSAGPANPNHRNRRGMVPLWGPMMHDIVDSVDILMEFGADLEIPDADGTIPSKFYLICGPKITAIVRKWLRKRNGEKDVLDIQKCGNPKCPNAATPHANVELKVCARCKMTRYCSSVCQRAHWRQHKVSCVPLSASAPSTVTLKPHYHSGLGLSVPMITLARNMDGIPTEPVPASHSRSAHIPKGFSGNNAKPKALVIKVQLPEGPGPLLVYTRIRDFVCMIQKEDNGAEYDKIATVIKSKGLIGRKAYFAAELQSKEVLVVNIDTVLPEQPF